MSNHIPVPDEGISVIIGGTTPTQVTGKDNHHAQQALKEHMPFSKKGLHLLDLTATQTRAGMDCFLGILQQHSDAHCSGHTVDHTDT